MDRVRDYRPRIYWGFCTITGKRQWCVRFSEGQVWSTPSWVFRAEYLAIRAAHEMNQSL